MSLNLNEISDIYNELKDTGLTMPNFNNYSEIRKNLNSGADVLFETGIIVALYKDSTHWCSITILPESPFHGDYHNQKSDVNYLLTSVPSFNL